MCLEIPSRILVLPQKAIDVRCCFKVLSVHEVSNSQPGQDLTQLISDTKLGCRTRDSHDICLSVRGLSNQVDDE